MKKQCLNETRLAGYTSGDSDEERSILLERTF